MALLAARICSCPSGICCHYGNQNGPFKIFQIVSLFCFRACSGSHFQTSLQWLANHYLIGSLPLPLWLHLLLLQAFSPLIQSQSLPRYSSIETGLLRTFAWALFSAWGDLPSSYSQVNSSVLQAFFSKAIFPMSISLIILLKYKPADPVTPLSLNGALIFFFIFSQYLSCCIC